MTRRTLLSAVTAAIAGKDSLQASSVDLQEMPVDSSKLYILYLDDSLRQEESDVQAWWKTIFAPDKAPKLVVCNRNYARLSIAQPLGADDIEAAVERGVARAMKAQEAGSKGTASPYEPEPLDLVFSPSEMKRREVLPFGLCYKCENGPVIDPWSRLCSECDPKGSAAYIRREKDRDEQFERRLEKEREWMARLT